MKKYNLTFLNWIKKIYWNLVRDQLDCYEEQSRIKKTLEKYKNRISLSSPDRYFWRSVCQYECQEYNRELFKKIIYNLTSAVLFFFLLIKIRPRKTRVVNKVKCEYLKVDNYRNLLIPQAIAHKVTVAEPVKHKYLLAEDLFFVIQLFYRNQYFSLVLMVRFFRWIMRVRPYLDAYEPELLIQYCEYSPTSSLRKMYLNERGISIVNVSHGEEAISCRNAFSSFDEYYVWSNIPESVHSAMYVESKNRFQFNPCEMLPQALKLKKTIVGLLWPADKNDSFMSAFISQLYSLKDCHVVVRPHPSPRYSLSFYELNKILKLDVSDSRHEDIHEFIDRISILIGASSAAMVEANLRGREIVYIRTPELDAFRNYNEYYQRIPFIEVESLASYILRLTND